MNLRQAAVLLACLSLGASHAAAQVAQTPVDGVDLFEKQVKPLLERSCFKCHSDPERAMSELLLTTRGGLLRGGARGPALDTSEPGRSLLLQALEYADPQLEMPPTGKLDDEELEVIRQWVAVGAPYGGEEDQLTAVARGNEFEITADDRAWWSNRPVATPTIPDVGNPEWAKTTVDRFLLAKLDAAGLEPSPRADRRTLIRRATYDLTGLPPTAEEVAAFEADDTPDAWERLLDRLLASPHYGEKWGRHWLDLVRYAETMGYERDSKKPGAWRYRDWVIDAFNADMPYDEFITLQLAGDEIDQVDLQSLIATGYLRLAIWDDEPTDLPLAQYDDLDSILDTTSRVMLGMSMGCARCHNHRGDPIPQTDYYSMLAFFRGIAPYKVDEGNAPNPENYTDRLPADWGQPDAGAATARWEQTRAARVARVREILANARAVRSRNVAARLRGAAEPARRGLVAHYQFDDALPLVAHDAAGNLHGRIEEVTVGAEGVAGAGFTFDGENDAVTLPRSIADDFTISIWFRLEGEAHGGLNLNWYLGSSLVDGNISGELDDFGLSVVGDGYVVAGTGNPYSMAISEPGYNDGEWHHVAMTRQRASGQITLYVDGEPVAEAVGNTNHLDAANVLEIGRLQVDRRFYFEGSMDELRLYDRVLDHREVLDLYLAPDGSGGGALAESVRAVAAHSGKSRKALEREIDALLTERRPDREYASILRIKELGPEAPPTHTLIRGNPHAPAEPVEPSFPQILTDQAPQLPVRGDGDSTTGRRLALARWIASPDNIRTSRVMANRLWQFHFGRGLVPTPNDFGRFGQKPTHPELLDWLAHELVRRGWSLKSMHKMLMTTAAYQMSSAGQPDALARDPQNELLWRFDMRRLTAEEIRDSILSANGTINLAVGGPSVYPPIPEEVLATSSTPDKVWGKASDEEATRRSVYIHVKRSLRHPLLDTLDLADTDATCPVRFVTTQPTQALTLLNSDFMQEQAAHLSARVAAHGTLEARVAQAIESVLARPPKESEIERGLSLIADLQSQEGFTEAQAFDSYSLLLLNLNEFVYLD